MPEGTVDVIPVDIVVAAIIGVAAAGPERAPADFAGRLWWRQPTQVPRLDRLHQRLVHRAPAVRPRGPADPRARMELPRSRQGREPAQSSDERADAHREGTQRAAVARPPGRVHGDARRQAHRDRDRQAVRRAVRAVHRVRGDLSGRQPARPLGLARRRRPRGLHLRPTSRRLGALHHPDPPPLDRAARSRQVDAGQVPQHRPIDRVSASRSSTPSGRSWRSTWRTP